MNPLIIGGLAIAVFIGSLVGTKFVVGLVTRRAILDRPNERSSHTTPTPTGGGVAVCAAVLLAWALIGLVGDGAPTPVLMVCGLAAGLAVVSWIDDLRGLNPFIRITAHIGAVITALYSSPTLVSYFSDFLPYSLGLFVVNFAWLWFINLYNFMDGIDGLAGVETVTVGVGIAAVAGIAGIGGGLPALGWTVAAAAAGFLRWNWHPAKVFLGDVGSVPLGFLVGWLLLTLAAHGEWAAALILPLYFIADATWTLARRAFRGERVWLAHHEHFYQRAEERGIGHDRIIGLILVTNLLLVALGIVAARGQAELAMLGAICAVVLLLLFLAKADPEV